MKKYPVALCITALVIVGCIVYSQVVTPRAAAEQSATTTTTAQTESAPVTLTGAGYIRDNANVLSAKAEKKLSAYNQTWSGSYGTRIAVVTVPSVSGDLSSAAIHAANEIGLSGYDMILFLDIGGQACYFDCGDSLWEAYVQDHNILSTYPNQYLYDDFMAGYYDKGVLKLMKAMDSYFVTCFKQIGAVEQAQYNDAYHVSNGNGNAESSIAGVLLMVILAVVILNWLDKGRYRNWRRRYGTNPAVMFVPWMLWHRPGSSWWKRNIGGMVHQPPHHSGFHATHHAASFGSSFLNDLFRGGHGGGFGGGFGGGHGGGFGAGGHGGGFGGGHH